MVQRTVFAACLIGMLTVACVSTLSSSWSVVTPEGYVLSTCEDAHAYQQLLRQRQYDSTQQCLAAENTLLAELHRQAEPMFSATGVQPSVEALESVVPSNPDTVDMQIFALLLSKYQEVRVTCQVVALYWQLRHRKFVLPIDCAGSRLVKQ